MQFLVRGGTAAAFEQETYGSSGECDDREGHEDLKTTQIYTQVAIRTLQQIHAATHPAELHDAPKTAQRTAEQAGLRASLQAEDEADEEPSS